MYINHFLNNDSIKSYKENYKEIADNADSEYKKWLKLSADLGFAKAQGELAGIYRLDGLIDYNNGEYNKAVSEYNNALIYATKASSQNDVKGTYWLAWMYYHGEGVEQNKEKAYALLYRSGAPDLGIKKDIHKALYYYDLACKQGLGDACNLFERVLKEK